MKIDWSGRRWGYIIAIAMVIVVTVGGYLLQAFPFYDAYFTDMLYILCVAISAIYFGFGPSIVASILSVLTFDFFFIPPLLKFTVATDQGIINLLILAIVTVVISCLSPRIRQ